MRKHFTRMILALSMCLLLGILNQPNAAAAAAEETTEGTQMNIYDYINQAIHDSIAVKTEHGVAIGSYGSGMMYYYGGFKYAYSTYSTGMLFTSNIAQPEYSPWSGTELPRSPFFIEDARSLYFNNGTFYFLSMDYSAGTELFIYKLVPSEAKWDAMMKISTIEATEYPQFDDHFEDIMVDVDTIPELIERTTGLTGENGNKIITNQYLKGDYILFLNNKIYYNDYVLQIIDGKESKTMYQINIYEYDIDTGKERIVFTSKTGEALYDMLTDGTNLYFYISYKESDGRYSYKAYYYNSSQKKLKRNTLAMPAGLKGKTSQYDGDGHYDYSWMMLVKQNSTAKGWKVIEKRWEDMDSWYVYDGALYYQKNAKEGKSATWYSINMKTGAEKNTGTRSVYHAGQVINTLDDYRIIMATNYTEITNLKDQKETYTLDWGFTDKDYRY